MRPHCRCPDHVLDPDRLPLGPGEWEEWNSRSPTPVPMPRWRATRYDNVREVAYPAILATTSCDASPGDRTGEVVRARLHGVAQRADRPIVLHTEMSAGHGGRSGRYDAWRETRGVVGAPRPFITS